MPMGTITINIRDGQLGITGGSIARLAVIMGICSGTTVTPASGVLATANTLYSFSQPADVAKYLGYGPGASAAAYTLVAGASSVLVMPVTYSTAGSLASSGTFTANHMTGSTGTVTGSGSPNDGFNFIVKVINAPISGTDPGGKVSAGNIGVQISLDGGTNYGPYTLVPASGTLVLSKAGGAVLGDTGVTLAFSTGSTYFNVGDTYTNKATGPVYTGTQLTSAFTALLADSRTWSLINVAGLFATTSAAVTAYSAVVTGMAAATAAYRYAYCAMSTPQDAGGDSTIFSTWASTADNTRIGVENNTENVFDTLYGCVMERGASDSLIGRLVTIAPSHSPGYADDGPLASVVSTNRDERATPGAFDQRFGCSTTVIGRKGVYKDGDGRVHCSGTSDYSNVMNRRVMDEVCTGLVNAAVHFQNMTVRLDANGHILTTDANKIQRYIKAQIVALAGTDISDVTVTVYATDNILSTQTLRCLISIVPLGYFKNVEFDVGFENPTIQQMAA